MAAHKATLTPAVKGLSWESVTPEEALELTGDHLEADFLVAFSALCMREAWQRKGEAKAAIAIRPHAWIEEFRVDFLIWQGKTRAVVECDDITLEAIIDRDRDELLEENGYGVFRFSAEDLTGEIEGCAQYVFDYFDAPKAKLTSKLTSRLPPIGMLGAKVLGLR